MRHTHEVRETDLLVQYEHDDAPGWHVALAREEHDHPLAVWVAAKGTLTADTVEGDKFADDVIA